MEDKILKCINEIGIIVDVDKGDNFKLDEIIEDSLMFVSLIVELESAFDIEIPDEFLLPEKLNTFNDLIIMINNLTEKCFENQ